MRHEAEYCPAAPSDGGLSAASLLPDLAALRRHVLAHPTRRIRVAELAGLCGLSISQFSRVFQRMTGRTPYAFVVAVRIEAGQALLAQGRPIADAAIASGFADQSHFTRHFRRIAGVTPRAFVRELRPGA